MSIYEGINHSNLNPRQICQSKNMFAFFVPNQAQCTQRNLSKVLLNQPEIRLCLLFSDWFGSKRTSIWIQINQKMLNTIWFQVYLIRFRKDFSVCKSPEAWLRIHPSHVPADWETGASRHNGGSIREKEAPLNLSIRLSAAIDWYYEFQGGSFHLEQFFFSFVVFPVQKLFLEIQTAVYGIVKSL